MNQKIALTTSGRIQINRSLPMDRMKVLRRLGRYCRMLRIVSVATPGNIDRMTLG